MICITLIKSHYLISFQTLLAGFLFKENIAIFTKKMSWDQRWVHLIWTFTPVQYPINTISGFSGHVLTTIHILQLGQVITLNTKGGIQTSKNIFCCLLASTVFLFLLSTLSIYCIQVHFQPCPLFLSAYLLLWTTYKSTHTHMRQWQSVLTIHGCRWRARAEREVLFSAG